MEAVILWGGFVGGWLLFAGPIYQAAIELREESIGETLNAVAAKVPPPERVLGWWWLVPPVHVILSRRSTDAYRKEIFATMSAQQRAQFVGFSNKATGWLTVAGGALLIAIKETWELHEHYEWPGAVFWVLIVVMFAAAVINTSARISRADSMIAQESAVALGADEAG